MKGCCILGCPFFGNRGDKNETTFHVFPDPDRELYRHNQWRDACNNPLLREKTCQQVYTLFRICRRHFDKESLNGGCRRLLNTAVPTLYLKDTTADEDELPAMGDDNFARNADDDGDDDNDDDPLERHHDTINYPKRRRIEEAPQEAAVVNTVTEDLPEFIISNDDGEYEEDGSEDLVEPIAIHSAAAVVEEEPIEWFEFFEAQEEDVVVPAAEADDAAAAAAATDDDDKAFEASNY